MLRRLSPRPTCDAGVGAASVSGANSSSGASFVAGALKSAPFFAAAAAAAARRARTHTVASAAARSAEALPKPMARGYASAQLGSLTAAVDEAVGDGDELPTVADAVIPA